MPYAQEAMVSSSQDDFPSNKGGLTGVRALVNRFHSAKMDVKTSKNLKLHAEPLKSKAPTVKNTEKSLYETFPWLRGFHDECQSSVGSRSIHILEPMVASFLKRVEPEVKNCLSKPNRAAKLKICLNEAIAFFHFYYLEVKESLEQTIYLDSMSSLLSMYLDMEIRSSRRGKEILKKITSRITTVLYLTLDNSQEHILDALLQCQSICKGYKEICSPMLGKILSDLQPIPRHELLYIRLLLSFKLWKTVARDAEEKKQLNKLATTKLICPPSLIERRKAFADVLPRVPKKKRKVFTQFLMMSKFCVKEASQAFLKITRGSMREFAHTYSELDFPSKSNSNSECLLKSDNESGSTSILNDIWSSMSSETLSHISVVQEIPDVLYSAAPALAISPVSNVPHNDPVTIVIAPESRKRKNVEDDSEYSKKKKRKKKSSKEVEDSADRDRHKKSRKKDNTEHKSRKRINEKRYIMEKDIDLASNCQISKHNISQIHLSVNSLSSFECREKISDVSQKEICSLPPAEGDNEIVESPLRENSTCNDSLSPSLLLLPPPPPPPLESPDALLNLASPPPLPITSPPPPPPPPDDDEDDEDLPASPDNEVSDEGEESEDEDVKPQFLTKSSACQQNLSTPTSTVHIPHISPSSPMPDLTIKCEPNSVPEAQDVAYYVSNVTSQTASTSLPSPQMPVLQAYHEESNLLRESVTDEHTSVLISEHNSPSSSTPSVIVPSLPIRCSTPQPSSSICPSPCRTVVDDNVQSMSADVSENKLTPQSQSVIEDDTSNRMDPLVASIAVASPASQIQSASPMSSPLRTPRFAAVDTITSPTRSEHRGSTRYDSSDGSKKAEKLNGTPAACRIAVESIDSDLSSYNDEEIINTFPFFAFQGLGRSSELCSDMDYFMSDSTEIDTFEPITTLKMLDALQQRPPFDHLNKGILSTPIDLESGDPLCDLGTDKPSSADVIQSEEDGGSSRSSTSAEMKYGSPASNCVPGSPESSVSVNNRFEADDGNRSESCTDAQADGGNNLIPYTINAMIASPTNKNDSIPTRDFVGVTVNGATTETLSSTEILTSKTVSRSAPESSENCLENHQKSPSVQNKKTCTDINKKSSEHRKKSSGHKKKSSDKSCDQSKKSRSKKKSEQKKKSSDKKVKKSPSDSKPLKDRVSKTSTQDRCGRQAFSSINRLPVNSKTNPLMIPELISRLPGHDSSITKKVSKSEQNKFESAHSSRLLSDFASGHSNRLGIGLDKRLASDSATLSSKLPLSMPVIKTTCESNKSVTEGDTPRVSIFDTSFRIPQIPKLLAARTQLVPSDAFDFLSNHDSEQSSSSSYSRSTSRAPKSSSSFSGFKKVTSHFPSKYKNSGKKLDFSAKEDADFLSSKKWSISNSSKLNKNKLGKARVPRR